MAIWQFHVALIPREALNQGEPQPARSFASFEEMGCWQQRQPHPGFIAQADALLPRAASWSNEIVMWGQEQGDRLSVILDDFSTDTPRRSVRSPTCGTASFSLAMGVFTSPVPKFFDRRLRDQSRGGSSRIPLVH